MSSTRRPIFVNDRVSSETLPAIDTTQVQRFHASLPGYKASPVIDLPELALELGIKSVLIKDESSRFGLPAFKILGASWGCFKAITLRLSLPSDTELSVVKDSLKKHPVTLFAATDGNHGRAVAFMAQMLEIPAIIFVPDTLDTFTKDAISNQGAVVREVAGDYDFVIKRAMDEARSQDGLLIQDTSWEGYEEVPQWIVEGYSTIFAELDQQVPNLRSDKDVVITPVGVGSLAHSVVQAFKSRSPSPKIVTVEPDTAACLYQSVRAGKPVSVKTSFTIMTGMDCGTVSYAAFEDLRSHSDISLTISDFESHSAVQYLSQHGVQSGPCGAAGIAALRRLANEQSLDADTVVVLLNTESSRPYPEPHDVSSDDPVAITQILTQIESTNTTLSKSTGLGEKQITDYIEAWLQHRDIPTHRLARDPARPSIIGIVKGTGNGLSLMINGHTDTVSLGGYDRDPLDGQLEERNGQKVITGRGAFDMKAGVAIGMSNLLRAKKQTLKGDVILCAVADEEDTSKGTEEVLAAGWRADAAIIPEPTTLDLLIAHKGFVWVEVTILGRAAHGSDPTNGIDAVLNTGRFLESLRKYSTDLAIDPILGQGTLHCGTIKGGEESSSYPASCSLTIEFRTVSVQSPESILKDIERLLGEIAEQYQDFNYAKPKIQLSRPSYNLPAEHDFVKTVAAAGRSMLGKELSPKSGAFWCDAALLGEQGIPTIIMGPSGGGIHGADEFVYVSSILEMEAIISKVISEYCS